MTFRKTALMLWLPLLFVTLFVGFNVALIIRHELQLTMITEQLDPSVQGNWRNWSRACAILRDRKINELLLAHGITPVESCEALPTIDVQGPFDEGGQ